MPDGDQNARLQIFPEHSTKFICFQLSITFLKQLWMNCWRCSATYAHLLIKADERQVLLPVNLNEAQTQSMTCIVNYYYLLMSYYCIFLPDLLYSVITCYYCFCYYTVITTLLPIITYFIITYYYHFCYYTVIASLLLIFASFIFTYYYSIYYYTVIKSLLSIITCSFLPIIFTSLLHHYYVIIICYNI